MSTQHERHEAGDCTFDTCAFCWEEHEALCEAWTLEVDIREEVPAYGNGDRMDDVEDGRPMGDGRATYLDDGE